MFGRSANEETPERPELDIPCADENSARAEAARRQEAETEGAEWIYLKRDRDHQWVARRWFDSGDDSSDNSGSFKSDDIIDVVLGVLNPLNWMD